MLAAFRKEMAEQVSVLVGYKLLPDNVFHDRRTELQPYIQELLPWRPLILMCVNGPLIMVLPYVDYYLLESGQWSVPEYIAHVQFYYGYRCKDADWLRGAYWCPLENVSGIHDSDKIYGYLRNVFEWPQDEVYEPNGRVSLHRALSEWVDLELRKRHARSGYFRLTSFEMHKDAKDELQLKLGQDGRSIVPHLSLKYLNDLLYFPYPKNYDWQLSLQDLHIVLVRQDGARARLPFDSPNKLELCREFWGLPKHSWLASLWN